MQTPENTHENPGRTFLVIRTIFQILPVFPRLPGILAEDQPAKSPEQRHPEKRHPGRGNSVFPVPERNMDHRVSDAGMVMIRGIAYPVPIVAISVIIIRLPAMAEVRQDSSHHCEFHDISARGLPQGPGSGLSPGSGHPWG